MRGWLFSKIRDYYFYKWLDTKNEGYLNLYHKWADKARPFLV